MKGSAGNSSYVFFPIFMTFVPTWTIGQTVKQGPWCSLFLLHL